MTYDPNGILDFYQQDAAEQHQRTVGATALGEFAQAQDHLATAQRRDEQAVERQNYLQGIQGNN